MNEELTELLILLPEPISSSVMRKVEGTDCSKIFLKIDLFVNERILSFDIGLN